MSGISTGTGLISGINTTDLIDQLIAIEARPRDLVEQRVADLTQQKTAYLDVNARLLSLKLSASSFLDSSVFGARSANSTNESVLTATADSAATPGSYTFTVSQLVSSHQMITRGFADTDTTAVGAGTLTFESAKGKLNRTVQLSQLNGAQGVQRGIIRVTDRTGASADVDLTKAVTLDDVIDAINTASGINVTASIDGDQLQLVDNTGATTSDLIVANVGSNTTAGDLGLAGNSGGTNTLTGTQINTISDDTQLSMINDGNGVRTVSGPDLTIQGHDGVSFDVDVSGALSVGDVIEKINAAATAAGSTVSAAVGTDQVSLQLTDTTAYSGTALTITAANGSNAAADLGLIYDDDDHDGVLTGDRVIASMGSVLLKNLLGGTGVDTSNLPTSLDPTTPIADLFGGTGVPTIAGADIVFNSTQMAVGWHTIDFEAGINTVQDLINRVNTVSGGDVEMTIEGFKLRMTDNAGGVETFRISDAVGVPAFGAAEKLGIEADPVSGTTILGVDTNPLLAASGTAEIQITNRSGGATTIDMGAAKSVDDVLDLINNAGAGVTASLNAAGNGIAITDTTGGTGDLIVTDTAGSMASQLGIDGTFASGVDADSGDLEMRYVSATTKLDDFNDGQGVSRGQFVLIDSNGVRATVDLSQGDEKTIQDVIEEINSRPTDIVASINSTGDGILLTDTGGGLVAMSVEESGSTTAADLNILGTAAGTGASNIINGSLERTVDIDADDTLEDVIDKINSADVGADATLINDGGLANPYRISLTSENSGSKGELLFDDGGLDFGASTLVKPSDAVVFFGSSDPTQAMLLTSSTNSLTDTIRGVTIDLHSTSTSPVQLTIAQDNETIVDAVGSFVTRFNDALNRINELDSFNVDTEQRGILLGDPTLAATRNSLYNLVNRQYGDVSGQYQYLTQIGIRIGNGARLTFDEAQFRDALASRPEDVARLFTLKTTEAASDEEIAPGITIPGSGTNTTATGFGAALESMLKGLTDSIDGRFTLSANNLDAQIELANDRIDQLNVLLDSKRQRYEAQFAAMETALAQLQAQQSSLASLTSLATSNR